MSITTTTRRVSYVLPNPTYPVPLLSLPPLTEPRNGRVSPFIVPHAERGSDVLGYGERGSDDRMPRVVDRTFSSENPFFTPEDVVPSPPSRARSATGPTSRDRSDPVPGPDPSPTHPRHCLGVASIALDTSTLLSGKSTPEGILYTGGRDGLVAAWELGIPQKRRQRGRWSTSGLPIAGTGPGAGGLNFRRRVRWERLEEEEGGGWGEGEDGYVGSGGNRYGEETESGENELSSTEEEDDSDLEMEPSTRGARRGLLSGGGDDEDDMDEDLEAGGWLQPGPAKTRLRPSAPNGGTTVPRRRSHRSTTIPYEHRWQVDLSQLPTPTSLPPPTTFRQSVQTHTDWVNDLLLCNLNQTLLSASSDRTIRAWSPHSSEQGVSGSPGLIGVHSDYVKVMSYAHDSGLLFSGGLDRQVMVWDVAQPRPDAPLLKLAFPVGHEGPRGSVYALTSNSSGSLVAAGSPERVVRMWDVRVGSGSVDNNAVSQFVGHTDNIRAILMSDDGKYILSGSSDCTIKLWSVAAQRCVHTFSYHTDSVWALHSDHPNLERFYSGDRSGYLCATDVTGCQSDYSDAECLLLAREEPEDGRNGTQGICQIVSMDDEFVWTATGSANVKRWRDVGRKAGRAGRTAGLHSRRGSVDRIGAASLAAAYGHQHGATTPTPPPLSAATARSNRIKRLSLEGVPAFGADNALALSRVDSREARSVAFAPTPAGLGQSRGVVPIMEMTLPSPAPSQEGTSFARSVKSNAASIISVDDPYPGRRADILNSNAVPFASLVCLGQAHTPYMPHNNSGVTHPGSLYSASVMSVNKLGAPSYPLARTQTGASSFHMRAPSHGGAGAPQPDPVQLAIGEYEIREVAADAEPLRESPEEVIKGRHGLLRAMVLNDRQHVLTVDTAGQVSIWHIITGVCLGRFDSKEINDQYHASGHDADLREIAGRDSKEALEVVREHIEGEAFVVTWCSVDTRIGSLTVHLEESRCFDAEVYADDVGYENDAEFKEDQRINLGKWVLANLFSGLIKAEALDIQLYAANLSAPYLPSAQAAVPSTAPGIMRSPAPKFIPIDRPSAPPGKRLRSYSSLSSTVPPTPGGLMVGLATPAITPAMLPSDAMSRSYQDTALSSSWSAANRPGLGLTAIPQSPMTAGSSAVNTPMNYTPSKDGPRSPKLEAGAAPKDYFSFRGARGKAVATPGVSSKDPSPTRAKGTEPVPQTPGGSVPSAQTPGGGLMGKFKFGAKKGSKTPGLEQSLATVNAEPEEDVEEEDLEPKIPEAEAAQLKILAAVRSHPFAPPPYTEAPPIAMPAATALLISEESKDAGAWAVTYRSMVSRTEQDIQDLEMASPLWLLDYLFAGRSRVRDPVKLCFVLEPWMDGNESEKLKAMPPNNNRLTANRVLRVRKIIHYIYDKLEMTEADSSRAGSFSSIVSSAHPFPAAAAAAAAASKAVKDANASKQSFMQPRAQQSKSRKPEDVIELLCHGQLVPVTMTLAAVRQFLWLAGGGGGDGGGDVVLHYRLKA